MNYILGINSAYHESSACLLADGKLVAFAEEERFTRAKHAKIASIDNPHILPYSAIDFCLEFAGVKFAQLDFIGYSFNPQMRLKNIALDKNYVRKLGQL